MNWKLVVEPDKVGGADNVDLFVDAIGLRVTTSGGCGGPAGTIDPLPLSDNYDASKLEFVSATPLHSSVTFTNTPYANTGVISWDNVGPLYAGQSKIVQVTFRALEPPSNLQTSTINYAAVKWATFSNGRPVNEPTAQASVTINPTGSIGDTIWNDNGFGGGSSGNGVQDGGETGIAGVTVELYRWNGSAYVLHATQVADADGKYLFAGLRDGQYRVNVLTATLPGSTFTQTGDPDGTLDNQTVVTITNANDVDTADFGYLVPNTVFGTIWHDNNGNTNRDGDDGGMSGVTVYLYDGSNVLVATTTTNADGFYQFSDLADGSYYVVVGNTLAPLGVDWQNTRDPEGAPGNHQSNLIAVSGGNVYGSYDFGYYQPGPHSISGNVYADWNGNASFDGNDTGFGGITVTLKSSTGAVIAITTTNPDGSYTFPNLPNGSYTVVVDESGLPPQYSQTENYGESGQCITCGGQASVTVNGAPVPDVNFGYEPAGYGTIGDRVWRDNNGNGIQNPGEPGIADITVRLYVDYGDGDGYVLVRTTVTDSNGLYSFTNLPPGSYRVEVDALDPDLPNDSASNRFVPTTPTTVDVALAGGQTYLEADFGFAPGGVIGDTIYWDANGNADQDWNEVGIPNVDVTLEVWNGSAWVTYATTPTDASGNYLFTGLPAGQYRVVIDTTSGPLNGRTLTGDPDTNGIPCDPDPGAPWAAFCDSRHIVDITPGQTYLGADFGYRPLGVIGDFVWLDGNGDGIQDPGEPGIEGVMVYLCNSAPCTSSNAVATTTTDYEGYYSFINVAQGTWYVAVNGATLPAGLTPTYDLDSGTTNPDGVTAVVLANAGDSNLNADFGYRLDGNYSISGTVYYDLNESGGDHVDEPGYENQPVYLWQLVSGSYVLVGTTTTDANGNYTFPNLPNGTYVVSTEATSPILNNAAHTTRLNENDATAWEEVTIANANVESVDFGFFIPTDFDDLPNTFQTRLSAGPYHIVNSALRLGAGIDLEPNGLPGVNADSDNFDDGVVRHPASFWLPGNTVQLTITVSGGSGVVGGWFDWNNDGSFGPGEFVDFGTFAAGVHSVSFAVPGTYTAGQALFARFRVFDLANVPGGSLTADDYQGGATGGEVEGYRWAFAPTAVTLATFSAVQQTPLLLLSVTGVLAMLLLSAVALKRRRRMA